MNQADEVDGAKKGIDSTGKVKHIKKERLIICRPLMTKIQMIEQDG